MDVTDVSQDANPFEAGPFSWLRGMVSATSRGSHDLWRSILITVFITWVPLAILSVVEGRAVAATPRESFFYDLAAYGRYLIAAPLFVLAVRVYLPQLGLTVRNFVEAGLIADTHRAHFDALVASTRRFLGSPWTDALLLLLAYISTIGLSRVLYPTEVSTWVARAGAGPFDLSLAGWWRTFVSQPFFQALLNAWLCRVLVWAWFLWRVSRMPLRLVAGHPDHMGGLRFNIMPVRGFTILAFGIGAMAAGSVAESILYDGQPAASFRLLIVGQVLVVLLIFLGPLFSLFGPLSHLHWRGTFEYGRLASKLGHQFEARWTSRGHQVDAEALAAPDFSATTDLFSIAANVREMNLLVLDSRAVIALTIATLLPYLPVLLAIVPLDEVVSLVLKTLM
jgi:hypothetical protein